MTAPKEQRRARRIAMSSEERDEFLATERTCRVATVGPDGPHATPLWYVWDGESIWLNSVVRSQRWADLARDPRIALVVDAGVEYLELRGVEITGTVEVVGEVPRTGTPDERLTDVERRFAQKYTGTDTIHYDQRHAWLRVVPTKIASWDFRKMMD